MFARAAWRNPGSRGFCDGVAFHTCASVDDNMGPHLPECVINQTGGYAACVWPTAQACKAYTKECRGRRSLEQTPSACTGTMPYPGACSNASQCYWCGNCIGNIGGYDCSTCNLGFSGRDCNACADNYHHPAADPTTCVLDSWPTWKVATVVIAALAMLSALVCWVRARKARALATRIAYLATSLAAGNGTKVPTPPECPAERVLQKSMC